MSFELCINFENQEQAHALYRFLRRCCFSDFRQYAATDEDAYKMLYGAQSVIDALQLHDAGEVQLFLNGFDLLEQDKK